MADWALMLMRELTPFLPLAAAVAVLAMAARIRTREEAAHGQADSRVRPDERGG